MLTVTIAGTVFAEKQWLLFQFYNTLEQVKYKLNVKRHYQQHQIMYQIFSEYDGFRILYIVTHL